jgi:hypothetical protein
MHGKGAKMTTVEFGWHTKNINHTLPSYHGQKFAIKLIGRWQHLTGRGLLYAMKWLLWHEFNSQPQKKGENIYWSHTTVTPLCRKSVI